MSTPFKIVRNRWLSSLLFQTMLLTGISCSIALQGLAQIATERHGDIFFSDKAGITDQITSVGKDYDPSLSADGKIIVFAREGVQVLDLNAPKIGALTTTSQLWTASTTGTTAPKLIVDGTTELGDRKFYSQHSPHLSPDCSLVYFLVDFAATTSAIVRFDLKTKSAFLIGTALQFSVVPKGKYRGFLVAQRRKEKLAPGYYDWFWLLDSGGNEIAVIGMDEGDVSLFLEMYGPGSENR